MSLVLNFRETFGGVKVSTTIIKRALIRISRTSALLQAFVIADEATGEECRKRRNCWRYAILNES